MKSEDQNVSKPTSGQNNNQIVDKSRRAFSKGGLVAPVIMTLSNRSAWGANVCVGTGFQSFAAAGGVLPSHAIANIADAGTNNWRSPSKWFTSYANWKSDTSKFLPVRTGDALPSGQSTRIYEIYLNGVWTQKNTGNKYTLSEVTTYLTNNNGLIGLVSQLNGFSGNNTTLYDAFLAGAGGSVYSPSLFIYQITTAMNQLLYPLSIQPKGATGGPFTLQDYIYFYQYCVNP